MTISEKRKRERQRKRVKLTGFLAEDEEELGGERADGVDGAGQQLAEPVPGVRILARKREKIFLSFLRDGPQQLNLIATGSAGRSARKGTPIDPFEETPSLPSVLNTAGETVARVMS